MLRGRDVNKAKRRLEVYLTRGSFEAFRLLARVLGTERVGLRRTDLSSSSSRLPIEMEPSGELTSEANMWEKPGPTKLLRAGNRPQGWKD